MRQITITIDEGEYERLELIISKLHTLYGEGFTRISTAAGVCFREGLEVQSEKWKLPELGRFGHKKTC